MKKIWEIFPKLAAAVREEHLKEGMTGSGHDFEHAARVGQYAYMVADDNYKALAGAAGLCHNADRILQKKLGIDRRSDVPEREIKNLIVGWLFTEWSFDPASHPMMINVEKGVRLLAVVDAVLKHGGKNDESDSPALIGLMDADRLVNIELDFIIRCGQFQPDLPAVDFVHLLEDPTADYRNPKSVFRDIYHSLEWDTDPRFALRTPKAIEMGKERFAMLRLYIETLKKQIEASGLVPYPF